MSDRHYPLSSIDRQRLDELLASIDRLGRLYVCDAAGQPVRDPGGRPVPQEYEILPSRQYLLDPHGRLWRYLAEGSPKDPAAAGAGGAPWRNSRVEMWNGRWRPEQRGAGPASQARTVYVKCLVARPIDKRINGQPGLSQIEWYCRAKGYRHPLEGPDELTPQQYEAWLAEQAGAGRQSAPAPAALEAPPEPQQAAPSPAAKAPRSTARAAR